MIDVFVRRYDWTDKCAQELEYMREKQKKRKLENVEEKKYISKEKKNETMNDDLHVTLINLECQSSVNHRK